MAKITLKQCRQIVDKAIPDCEDTLKITKEVIKANSLLHFYQEFNDEYHGGEIITEEDVYETIIEGLYNLQTEWSVMIEFYDIYHVRQYLTSSSLTEIKGRLTTLLYEELTEKL